jgi:hypothetical protein
MKKIIFLLFAVISISATAQDVTPIQVDLPDNPRLQWSGAAVKQRAIVLVWQPMINGNKEFYIKVKIQNWSNSSGVYGSLITSLIQADGTLSADQQSRLLIQYGDWIFEHQSTGVYCDNTTGAIVSQFQADGVTPTVNAVPESAYWQQFKLNQVSGMNSLTTQGAFDAEYKIIKAVVAQMSTRKNW